MHKYRCMQKTIFSLLLCLYGWAATAQNVGINTNTPQATLDVYGDVIFRSADLVVTNGTTLALDVNTNRFSFYRMAGPSADFTIAGLTQGVEGRLVTLFNRSGFTMQLNNLDAAAAVNDRIITGANADITIADKGIVNLLFDGAEQKWVVLSNNKPGGGTTSGGWGLTGNTGNTTANYIGNNDGVPFLIKSQNLDAAYFSNIYQFIGQNFQRTGIGMLGSGNPTHTLEIGTADLAGGSQGVLAVRGTEHITHFNYGASEDVYIRGGKAGSNVYINDATGLGQLAIGTNVPDVGTKATLQTADYSTALCIKNPSGSAEFNAYVGGPVNGNTISLGTTGDMPIALYTNNANRVFITGTGNVGIGVDNPFYKLSVNGTMSAQGNVMTYNNTFGVSGGSLSLGNINGNNQTLIVDGGSIQSTGLAPITFLPALKPLTLNPFGGTVGIGTTNPDPFYKLSVNGKIRAKEIRVNTGWADYVFAKNYRLKPLAEVERYIKKNQHLPGIAPASKLQKEGVDISVMQTKMMEKIEELTLYLIEANKKIEALEKAILQQKK
jgi:hypothetical protein